MKKYNLHILLILICFSCSENVKPKEEKQVVPESKAPISVKEKVEEPILESNIDSIYALNSGNIEWLNESATVRKSANFYRINNSKSFELIYIKKQKCKKLIDSLIETAPTDLIALRSKWQSFSRNLQLDSLTPPFPRIEFKEEAQHYGNSEMIDTYNDLLIKERKMKNNFQLAKRSYSKIDWRIKEGQKVKKGELIGVGVR